MEYRHLQTSYKTYGLVLVGLVVGAVVLAIAGGSSEWGAVALVSLAVLLPVGIIFSRLMVEVDSDSLCVAFGWGWPKRSVDLSDVKSARTVRNRWYEGWGIHKVRGGWLYNVGGMDAVELELRSGRVVRIGSDEPDDLARALSKTAPNSRL